MRIPTVETIKTADYAKAIDILITMCNEVGTTEMEVATYLRDHHWKETHVRQVETLAYVNQLTRKIKNCVIKHETCLTVYPESDRIATLPPGIQHRNFFITLALNMANDTRVKLRRVAGRLLGPREESKRKIRPKELTDEQKEDDKLFEKPQPILIKLTRDQMCNIHALLSTALLQQRQCYRIYAPRYMTNESHARLVHCLDSKYKNDYRRYYFHSRPGPHPAPMRYVLEKSKK